MRIRLHHHLDLTKTEPDKICVYLKISLFDRGGGISINIIIGGIPACGVRRVACGVRYQSYISAVTDPILTKL